MMELGSPAQAFQLKEPGGAERSVGSGNGGGPVLLAFFTTDCPACQLTMPYLDRLARALGDSGAHVIGISQDGPDATRRFVQSTGCKLPIVIDEGLSVSRQYDPEAVPTLILIDKDFKISDLQVGFNKAALNSIAEKMSADLGIEAPLIAPEHDGAPASKPGCGSRHLEPEADLEPASDVVYARRGERASRVDVPDGADPYDFCREQGFGDYLPVIPPTVQRVERMLAGAAGHDPEEVVALVPPNYGMATVEKIAANAVMAGCAPEMMPTLMAAMRAVCDEKFNIHGVQATTHFAAPLTIVNGPIRNELEFAYRSNVFSNVARANSTVGRAMQLILSNIGGARPGGIDMSALGNPGKFSFCIAENEEESPWEPYHVEQGFRPDQSTVTMYACEAPHGVSEHNTRDGRQVLRAIASSLACVWSYRACIFPSALVVICPEHIKTLKRTGMTKQEVKEFLYENTGVPVRAFKDAGRAEGAQLESAYEEIMIDGEPHYRKFASVDNLKIIVAGGTAGKFSAVLGSWLSGPRGSQSVTYPIE